MLYPIWIKDGRNPEPKTPVYYILASNGFFIHKETPFWKTTVPVKEISILKEAQPELELYLPPIPVEITREIVQFFAWVFRQHRTEAMVLLWYSPKTQTYRISAPAQKVAPGSIRYDMPDRDKDKEEFLAGTFHSHATHSAYHSSTDRCDEASIDGIHGTFGSFGGYGRQNEFSLSLQAAVNGQRFVLDPLHWLQGVESASPKKSFFVAEDTRKEEFASPYYPSAMFKLKPTGPEDDVLPRVDYVPIAEWANNITVDSWWENPFYGGKAAAVNVKTKPVLTGSKPPNFWARAVDGFLFRLENYLYPPSSDSPPVIQKKPDSEKGGK